MDCTDMATNFLQAQILQYTKNQNSKLRNEPPKF